MARIVKEIEAGGRTLRALFDSGSLRSYIKAELRPPTTRRVKPIMVGLGGEIRRLDERCDLTAAIDGLEFDLTAYIVEELGETEHGPLDAVVGALTMEEWYIKLDPRTGELDLSGLRKREFTEYVSGEDSQGGGERGEALKSLFLPSWKPALRRCPGRLKRGHMVHFELE